MLNNHSFPSTSDVENSVRKWLENMVIGLNLCPFAKSVYIKNQVRIVVYEGEEDELLGCIESELLYLQKTLDTEIDTTLVVVPHLLKDYYDFNDFLIYTDALIEEMGLEGEIQIADFHPYYQFAGTQKEDVENYTNRSPYPIFHLLRESSIDRAVEQFPDAAEIFERNISKMQTLGIEKLKTLLKTES